VCVWCVYDLCVCGVVCGLCGVGVCVCVGSVRCVCVWGVWFVCGVCVCGVVCVCGMNVCCVCVVCVCVWYECVLCVCGVCVDCCNMHGPSNFLTENSHMTSDQTNERNTLADKKFRPKTSYVL